MSLKSLIKKMNALAKTSRMELSVATTMLGNTADRIFHQGKAADGNIIGKYTIGYAKQRAKVGLSISRKIILQGFMATNPGTKANRNAPGTTNYTTNYTHMVNDWSVINTSEQLGLGFKNEFNANKSEWVEETYGKPIFEHTKDELTLLGKLLDKEIKKVLNG